MIVPFQRLFNRSSSSLVAAPAADASTSYPTVAAPATEINTTSLATASTSNSLPVALTHDRAGSAPNVQQPQVLSTPPVVSRPIPALSVIQPPTSTTLRPIDYSTSIWEKAFGTLSQEDKDSLTLDPEDHHAVLEKIMQVMRERKEICEKERWTFPWRGDTIVLSDVADKAIAWVQRFIQVGDTVNQYDPGHSALPWAGVRFLLQVGSDYP